MRQYYLNRNEQSNGDHEVHVQGCSRMPGDPIALGLFNNCDDALTAAKKHYAQSNGCYYCIPGCHTQ